LQSHHRHQEFATKFKSAIKTLKRMIWLWCKISTNLKQLKCVDDMTKPPPGSDEFFSLSWHCSDAEHTAQLYYKNDRPGDDGTLRSV
jgi:hypothetical protein